MYQNKYKITIVWKVYYCWLIISDESMVCCYDTQCIAFQDG